MKKPLVAVCLLAFAAAPLRAAFGLRHTSARSAAMGNAFLSSNDEAASLFSNPAGLGGLAWPEAALLYAKPHAGLEGVDMAAGLAALGAPSRWGGFAAGYSHFQAEGALSERTYALGYGVAVSRFRAGVTVKQLVHAYEPASDPLAKDDPVFARRRSRRAAALDAGLTAPVLRLLNVGVAVRNVNRPDVGIATEDRLPMEVQAGAALDFAGLGLRGTGDVLLRSEAGAPSSAVSFGLEKTFNRVFALRAGVNSLEYAAGFGFRRGSLSLDYAAVFSKSLLGDGAGSHKAGVTYRFIRTGDSK